MLALAPFLSLARRAEPPFADVLDAELAGGRIYLADQDRNDVFELYTVPADGSGAVHRLNSARANHRDEEDLLAELQG